MVENVVITLNGAASAGRLVRRGEKRSLLFKAEGASFTVSLSEGKMRLCRRGELTYDIELDPSRTTFGTMEIAGRKCRIGVTTHALDILINENGAVVDAVYTLDIDGIRRHFTLSYTEN